MRLPKPASFADEIERPRVALLVESSRAYGRGCLRGIASFLRLNSPWNILHFERGFEQELPSFITEQKFDGVVARIENEAMAKTIERMNIPTVDLLGALPAPWSVSFDTDPVTCGQLAFTHFHERGFRNLAFCGYDGLKFSDQREASYTQSCRNHSIKPFIFSSTFRKSGPKSPSRASIIAVEMQGEFPEETLIQWLKSLPAPIGVFCCNDMRGRQVLQAGRLAGRKIPEEIAVVGVDDDEVICELADPPLSSIEPDTHKMGFEAAAILDKWMRGYSVCSRHILVPPKRVTVRRSSDLLAIDDEDVAAAVRFIHQHACDGIDVNAVARAVAVSRVTLERRFRVILHRSPRQEIERVRIDKVRSLLTQTNYTLMQIAAITGYNSDAHLITVFRCHENCTPGAYRKRAQANTL